MKNKEVLDILEDEDVLTSSPSVSGILSDSQDSQCNFSPVEMPLRPWMPIELPPIAEIRKTLRQGSKSVPSKDIVKVPPVPGDELPNPFDTPCDLTSYMGNALKEKVQERNEALKVPTLEKETFATKAYKIVAQRIAPFTSATYVPSEHQIWKQVIWEAKKGLNVSHMQKISRHISGAYITHRKKLFYLDHAIHARRLALKKLRRDAELEERALKNFEWLVQFTQDAFDNFLKENDDDTMAAVHA